MCIILTNQATKSALGWVLKAQACLIFGATFQIAWMLQIYIINTDMTKKVNRKSAVYCSLSSLQAISFAIFAFEYYQTALGRQMMIQSIPL